MDKRYCIVAGAFLVQSVIIGSVFSYGVYFNELETEFGWSRTQLSTATALAFLSMGLMAAFVGQASDRFGPRWVIAVAAICTGMAYCLLYFLSSPWQLFLIYGTLVGVGLATHDVVTLSAIAKWFPRRRGLMSGVVKVGTAFGQMLVPLIVVVLISRVGWRESFVILGIGATVILLLAAWLMGIRPEQTATQRRVDQTDGSSFAQAKTHRSLWMLCAIHFFSFASLTTIPTHAVPHAIDSGLPVTAAAFILTIIAFSSIFGRLIIGSTVDNLGGLKSYTLCLALLVLSLSALVIIENPRYLYAFAVVYGFAHGGLFTVISPIVAELFGMREHGKIFGLVVFFGTIGGSSMPIVTGKVFDLQGSYTFAFMALTALAIMSLILSLVLHKHQADQESVSE